MAKEAHYHSPAIAAKKKPAGSLSRPPQALVLALTDCPQANTFALAERMVSLENVQAMCKNGYRDSFCTFGTDVTLHLKPTYDMDGRTTFNAVEVAYEVSFRGPDAMPGSLDDRVPHLVFVCVVGCHGEIGDSCVTNVAEPDASDSTDDFNSVELFDVVIHGRDN